MEATTNKDDVALFEAKKLELEAQGQKIHDPKEIVRPKIPLSACIQSFAAFETVDDFYSSAIKGKTIAKKSTRLSSFPDYLMVHLKKFTIGDDWVPKKLDVSLDVPDNLDLSSLRGKGLQPGEEELPQEAEARQEVQIDEVVVAQLVEMGFPIEACKKAVFNTNNSGVEPAMNWVMEHMEDQDFNAPFVPPGGKPKAGSFVPNEDAIGMVMSMGFNRDQAIKALKNTDNNVERAVDWIFSHTDELDTPMETEAGGDTVPNTTYRDGEGKYKLVAFISHMGTSTMVGHYVCHIKKEGRWVIYNDEKVALSEHPPRDLAYLYLYQRQ